ncbi:MAG: P13 family porin [Spirochaetia bacterium]|nr:P13 family porin [Spirochaetia bacterium]
MRIKNRFFKLILLFSALALCVSNVFSSDKNEKKVPRVLILDFVNTNDSPNYRYLEGSVPESFSSSLGKLKKFQIMDRSIWANEVTKGSYSKKDALHQMTAINVAKKYNADIVIVGSFSANEGQVQIFSKSIEVSTERIIFDGQTESTLDGNLFTVISKVSNEMAIEMDKKLPEITLLATNSKNRFDIISLIVSDLSGNKDLISNIAANYSNDERNSLFSVMEKEPIKPFLINALIGYGLGSFTQGDRPGGKTALYGELGSIGAIILGGTSVVLGSVSYIIPLTVFGGIFLTGGIIGLVVFKVYEMIRPFFYSDSFNTQLRESLRLAFTVKPYIYLAQNGEPQTYGVELSGKF